MRSHTYILLTEILYQLSDLFIPTNSGNLEESNNKLITHFLLSILRIQGSASQIQTLYLAAALTFQTLLTDYIYKLSN